MDSSWKMKCDSPFQPSASATMEMNAGHCPYPRVAHGLRSKFVGGMQDPVYPSFRYSTNHGDTGNSFVALLYGPPSLLQCDFQELSDQKLCTSSGNCTAASRNFVVDSIESGIFPTSSSGLVTENSNNHILQSRPVAIPDISSRAMVGLSSSSHSVFHDIQSSNTAAQPTVPGGEKAREPFSSRSQWCGTSPESSQNICGSDIQTMPNMVLEQCSSKHNSLILSGCPRVFCMGKSGYLLLSNTGLLGIVCSCHYCHMSVLKFCEHSGLHGINPGDAVHMESGETIAQWQKLYFLKFGIRSPGNESEWDWPEVLSTTGSLMKSNASAFNMSKNDLSHSLSSSAVILRKQPTTIQEGGNILPKGFTVSSQNNLCDRVKSQIKDSKLATCTIAPNFVGTQLDDGCQPTPPFLDSLKRNENLSIAHSPSQTPTSLLKDQERIKNNNAKDVLLGKDAASSNIELRLGQPPQTGNPVPSFIEPPLFNALVSPPKLHPLKPMINMLSREEELQKNFCHAAGSFKLRNYMSGVSNALGGARTRSETENVPNSLFFSPFPLLNPQPEGKTKASAILLNDGGPIMSKNQHSEFSTMQFGPTNVLWNGNGHIGRQLNSSATGSIKFMDNDKGMSFGKDSSAKLNSGFGISKLVEYPSSITRAVGGSDSCISTVNGKICESHNESSLPSDTSTGANFLCGSRNVSPVGQNNHLTSGMAIPFERILKGFPFFVSSSASNQTPTLLQQQGFNMDTPLLDEHMRLLALTQILELSKQQHVLHFHEMNQKQGRSSNTQDVQPYVYEASTSEQFTSGGTLKLPQNRVTCGNPDTTDDLEKLASLTGLSRSCFSALAPIPLHSKEKESQCKGAYDLRNEGPSLSLGINKDNSRSSACENFTEKPLDINLVAKHTFADQVNCSRSNFFSGIGPSCYTFKEQFASAGGETSLKIASKFGGDQNASKDESIPSEQCRKLDGLDSTKIGSRTQQWRDVPSKVRKADCDATSLDPSATVLDWEGQDGVQHVNTSAKRFKKTINMEDLLKEQENSNVSSGSSVPVVTQASVEFNKVDSCTIDGVDAGYVNNLVVDESSGIDKGWSRDAVESERSAEFLGSTCESYLKKGYLRVVDDQPCCSLLDELKLLDSLTWKKGQDRSHIMLAGNCKANLSQKVKKDFKGKKRKRNKVRNLDASLSSRTPSLLHNKNRESTGVFNFPSSVSKDMQMYCSSSQQRSSTKASFFQPSTKRKNSAFSSKFLSCKNFLSKHHSNKEDSYLLESNSDAVFHTLREDSGRKKLRTDFPSDCFGNFQMQDPACEEPENAKLKSLSSRRTNAYRITRPIVWGDYGEICSGKLAGEMPKPAKIVSLSKVLKTSKGCMVPTNRKPRLTSKKKWKRLSFGTSSEHCCGQPGLKTKESSETQNTTICNETDVDVSMEDLERANKPLVIYKGKRDTKAKQGDNIVNRAELKLKSKKIQKQRSIYEFTAKESKVKEILEYAEDREHGRSNTNSRNFAQERMSISILNSDAFCCVCRSSSNDDINCLLECSRCLIRVHQACYGISTLPKKGRWCCRPCRTNSKDIACVLCGYGGGAMTRAIQSRPLVKSLLKVWSIENDGMPKPTTSREVFEEEIDAFGSSKSGLEVDQTCVLRPENVETSRSYLLKVEISTNHMQHAPCSVSKFKVHNSITAGVLDTSVKQWVHMVCGLWTPGTRCPNVDTMSAFDVSGVTRPRADVVCSICNRWGGSCIECRIVDCSVKFHPWCAHQKNLLQCETEGADDEKVGFYGRCMVHAIDPRYQSKCDPIDEIGSLEGKEFTCARTEGYKGRKRDGFHSNRYSALKSKGGCLVPEEQLNAWIHINGQKLCSLGLPKPASDIEQDCRKEYARYKQAKGWKHLVVYKSGIHALGLYTSRFIFRGEMVVEYVGEVVGLRVADKREIEYQSGRKLQYKSACYFFRIDKEHIIDATRKGGIARFVNHSCLPNCVAKVISVRHEKKVVFFAERDIYPGEEITYDYHFNHEDEGKKIPCYCNAKNCRRYLN